MVFAKLQEGEIIEWEDGATFAGFQRVKNTMRKLLFFTD
jgi:hypothetical protein